MSSPPSLALQSYNASRVPYDAALEDSIMRAVLSPPQPTPASRADSESIPTLSINELPLGMNDPRRRHPSQVPGIDLSEPRGSLFGGSIQQQISALSPAAATPDSPANPLTALASSLRAPARPTEAQLARFLNSATEAQLAELRRRARARADALETNARVDRELADLTAQREVEVRVERRMREQAGKKGSAGGG